MEIIIRIGFFSLFCLLATARSESEGGVEPHNRHKERAGEIKLFLYIAHVAHTTIDDDGTVICTHNRDMER
jgi:hypothetical protein